MLDLDQKRRLAEIFFESNESPINTNRKLEKELRQNFWPFTELKSIE